MNQAQTGIEQYLSELSKSIDMAKGRISDRVRLRIDRVDHVEHLFPRTHPDVVFRYHRFEVYRSGDEAVRVTTEMDAFSYCMLDDSFTAMEVIP